VWRKPRGVNGVARSAEPNDCEKEFEFFYQCVLVIKTAGNYMGKLNKKLILIIIVLILVVGGFWGFRQYRANAEKSDIKTAKVKKKNLSKIVSASGKINALKEVTLKFQTSGQLVWVGVGVGDTVEAYQAVAQLDVRELELNLKKKLRDYSKERWDFEEDRQITYRDTVLTDTIKRILEKNQFDLDKAVMDVELKDIALKFATLTTPISGVVTQVDTPVAGVNITPATALFKVADPDSLVFQAEVDEVDIGMVSEGQKVTLYLDAYPDEELTGTVTKIAYTATATSGGGTAYLIDVTLAEKEGVSYKIGMNGDVDIVVEKKSDILFVDYNAVKTSRGKTYVYVELEDRKFEKRLVEIGMETDDYVEITKGLAKDEKVVLGKIDPKLVE